MNSKKKTVTSEKQCAKQGFDAPVDCYDDDVLARWPFAQEIYRVATTGPKDWSVRIGVYGEWGSGKSSVLYFVDSMARRDGHIVVWFNPWEFASTDELWMNFVRLVQDEIEKNTFGKKFSILTKCKHLKTSLARYEEIARTGSNMVVQGSGDVLRAGFSFFKAAFTFSKKDLAELKAFLGNRRLVVIVDDLDRANQRLVPEILFGFKQIMDIPGISFVCAFDPAVVGETLGEAHPGFGDGLRFLEKIIDYPKWLPPLASAQLANLAIKDSKQYCEYVPPLEIQDVIPLLPQNPRSVRQFIRLIALLRPQIERHREDEIKWPILLAANVLKVQFPSLGEETLADKNFWQEFFVLRHSDGGSSEEKEIAEKKATDLVNRNRLDNLQKDKFIKCVLAIAKSMHGWFGPGIVEISYQFHLAEKPCAVTWKEFDELLFDIGKTPSNEKLTTWIKQHSEKVSQSQYQVFIELVNAIAQRRRQLLDTIANTKEESAVESRYSGAKNLLVMLRILLLDENLLRKQKLPIGVEGVKEVVDSLKHYCNRKYTSQDIALREDEAEFLRDFVSAWKIDIIGLVDAIGIRPSPGEYESSEWRLLMVSLRADIQGAYADWIADQFHSRGAFMSAVCYESERGHLVRSILWDVNGPLWKDRRSCMLEIFQTSPKSEVVRHNVIEFLSHCGFILRRNEPEKPSVEKLLADNAIVNGLWIAATCKALNPTSTLELMHVLEYARDHGCALEEPIWWGRAASIFKKKENPISDQNRGESGVTSSDDVR